MEKNNKKIDICEKNIREGMEMIQKHPFFGHCPGILMNVQLVKKEYMGKDLKSYIEVHSNSEYHYTYINWTIKLNKNILLSPKEWAYIIVHNYLHLIFGHFCIEKVPGFTKLDENGKEVKVPSLDKSLWNKACDIYIWKFLNDIKFGESPIAINENDVPANLHDEISIYNYLMSEKKDYKQIFGMADVEHLDMLGLDNLIAQKDIKQYVDNFTYAISSAVQTVVEKVSEKSYREKDSKFNVKTIWGRAASWFLASYPLLGGLAASFKIVDEKRIANQYDVDVAAIDIYNREIIINPVCRLSELEWRFVLAHEYLHAGLCHGERCQGRNEFIWNVACDYVINLWLKEMQIGEMPKVGLMYDETLKGKSAEEIYDEIMRKIKKSDSGLLTFRGACRGDIIDRGERKFGANSDAMSLDDFCKEALRQGLEYHKEKGRGFIPAGLEEEIKALSMPAIPWDVELANWFEKYFTPLEKHRSYARPSRRQSSTPNIPRPRTVPIDLDDYRTFGVVIDTSGSMSAKNLGMALGSIASFASAKDVEQVRVVFCDANAYDAGYMTPEDIAGRVRVKGRGGTILQPGIDLLEKAKDFPKTGPILIITDGWIEDNLKVHRDHAYLIPRGNHLPFIPKGEVFYFKD